MPRNFLIQIKVSEQEKAQVKADAARMKQNVSEYARSLLLHEKSHNEILDPHEWVGEKKAEAIAEESDPPRPSGLSQAERFKEAADRRASNA